MEYNVIDADGHVLEPPDLWENYIEPRFRECCPKLLFTEDGARSCGSRAMTESTFGRGKKPLSFRRAGTFGARDGGVKSFRVPYLEGKPGGFDPHARIPDMDAEGIDAAFLIRVSDCSLARSRTRNFRPRSAAPTTAGWRIIASPIRTAVWRRDAADAIGRPRWSMRCVSPRKELGLRCGFIRPNPYNGRMLHDRCL